MIGRVESWGDRRGFGFVRAGGRSYFVHASAVADGGTLTPGEAVIFTPTDHKRGRRAVHVRRAPTSCPKCGAQLQAAECSECGFVIEAAGDDEAMPQTLEEEDR